ncbi:MAG: acetyltransferase-like isoleucine patch superfamily enzyme [Oleiphilaceae bacterium]|jgi:acetyltransferase-like isoleucine patch superfamily enzyme
MIIKKYFWALRMALYSLFYKNIKMPGYLGKPILMVGVGNIKLGKRVRIFPNSRFEIHKDGQIDIQDNVSIGQGLHITSQGSLTICSGTVISGNVVLTNIDHDYQDITMPVLEQPHIVRDTFVGENCFIGFGAVIQAGTILGRHCIVGANSVVRGTFPDGCVIAGVPAKIVKQYDHSIGQWVRSS